MAFSGEGTLKGAGTGAVIGTAIAPGIGTVLGGLGGGLLGSGLLGAPDDPTQGYGVRPQGPFEEHQTGPGLQTGNANGMTGVDMTKPGMAENFASGALSHYQQAGIPQGSQNTQNYYNNFQNQRASAPQVTNKSASYAADYNANRPSMGQDAGYGAYFDNAEKNAAAGINSQMAARGMYGSSAATGQLAGMYGNMEGERAKNNADYQLRAAGENRAAASLGGQLTQQGDQQSLGANNAAQGWTQLGGNLASQADQNSLGRSADERGWLDTLGGVALGGQNSARTRGQDFFGNEMSMGDRYSGMMGDTYDKMIGDDNNLRQDADGLQIGLAGENQNIQKEKGNGIMGGMKNLVSGIL